MLKIKRCARLTAVFLCAASFFNTAYALVSEYTLGIREKDISITDYEYFADEQNKDAFAEQKFVERDEASSGMRIEDNGQCLANTSYGAFIRFNRMDFGESDNALSMSMTFARDAGYGGLLRVYALPCGYEISSAGGGEIKDLSAILLVKYEIDKNYTTGGWYVQTQTELNTEVEALSGVYDIVFTFNSHGLGCYYDFCFNKNDTDTASVYSETANALIDCETKIKFASADESSYSNLNADAEYVGSTCMGKWLAYHNVDFGDGGVEYLNFKAAKDGPHRGYMNIYLLDPGSEIQTDSDGVTGGQLILAQPRNGNHNTGSWFVPKEESIKIDGGENINGVHDIVIMFTADGMGNFYDFSFSKFNSVKLSNAGEIRYSEYIPFDISGVEIVYDVKKDCNFTVDIDGEKTTDTMKAGKNKISAEFKNTIFKGNKKLTVSSDGYVEIKEIAVKKVKTETAQLLKYARYDGYSNLRYTDTEKLLKTAIIFNNNSSVYLAKNAQGYINYNDAAELPYNENGTLYVPLSAVALATGAYFEENKNFCMIRFDNAEVFYKNNTQYLQENNGSYNEVQTDIKEMNGTYYVPLKKYLELSGRYVCTKDDFVIADYELKVKEIISDKNFELLTERFNDLLFTPAEANVYYVSQTNNASDENSGTASEPFRTISKAAQTAKAGDTVVIGDGIYRETVKPTSDGSVGHPIVYRAEEGANVIISALDEVDGEYAEEDGKRVYTLNSTMPQGRNMIFLKGEALAEGRYPNQGSQPEYEGVRKNLGLCSLWPTSGNIKIVADSPAATIEAEEAFSTDYFKDATLVSHNGSGWTLATAKVTGSDDKNLTLDEQTTYWWYDNITDYDYAYLTGFKNSVDVPGEWYIDDVNNKLYIIPLAQEDTYEIKSRQVCIDLSGKKYVQFKGINTIGGGINIDDGKMCVINGGEHKYISHYTYSSDQHYGFIDSEDAYDANGAPRRGEMGIYMGGSDNAVINADIKYSAAAGIYNTEKHSLIYNNNVEETGYMCAYVGGIFMMPDAADSKATINDVRGGHRIYYNTIDKTGRACIEMSAMEQEWFSKDGLTPFAASDIAYNNISNGSILSRDTGNVYIHGVVLGDDENKTQFRNNIISNQRNTDSSLSWGVYFDNWAQMAEVYENILTFTDYSRNIEKSKELLIQPKASFPEAFAYINVWNNKLLENKREFPLADADYPNSKRFRCGANSECENYAVDISKPVSLSGGTAWVCVGTEDNALELYYEANPFKEKKTADVSINGEEYKVNIDTSAVKEGYINSVVIPIGMSGGEAAEINIDGDEGQIYSVKAIKGNDKRICGKCYGGEFDEGTAKTKTSPDGQHMMMYETWSQYTVKYSDVYIRDNVDMVAISYSTAAMNSGGSIRIRIGDAAQTEEIVTAKNSWDDYSPVYGKLLQTVSPGVYDIYVDVNMKQPQTINLWWFGFMNESSNVKDAYAEIDISQEDIRFNAELTNGGVWISNDSVINLGSMDFGDGGRFKLTADFDLANNSDLSFVVEADGAENNILLKPEYYTGAHYGIVPQIQASEPLSGVHSIKLKFEGNGNAVLKSLRLKKADIYLSAFDKTADRISGAVQNTGNVTISAVYASDGRLERANVYDSTSGYADFEMETGDEYIVKIFSFTSMNTIAPTAEYIVYAHNEE